MFTIGKRRKRIPYTPEQKAAFAEIRQAATKLNMDYDSIAQLFGYKSFNSLQAIPSSGEKAVKIVEVLRNLKRLAINTV